MSSRNKRSGGTDIFSVLRETPGDPQAKTCALRYFKTDFVELSTDEEWAQAFHDLNCVATLLSAHGRTYNQFLKFQRDILKEIHRMFLERRSKLALIQRLDNLLKPYVPEVTRAALRRLLEEFC